MTKLQELYSQQGQSPWIDNLTRNAIQGGGLREKVGEGIRGVTSNPTIFQKAMTGSDAYDEQFTRLLARGSAEAAFWDMAIEDVSNACGVLRPVYDESAGSDGFVSIEVSPALASDTAGTIEAARNLHERIALPNLLVKIPATAEGVPAIRKMISEGRNINITLIFSLERYIEVIEAYLSGLEELGANGGDLSNVHSVASFFVSRVDTEVDRRLERIGGPAGELAGKAAVAQAKLAYELFQEHFSGERWAALEARGAHLQRPLWASTSTKNPAYPDLLYVDNLIGPHTVNTLPDKTIEAFEDHGSIKRTVDTGVDEAHDALDRLAKSGVDLADVARVLEEEGVSAFLKSYDELLQALEDKANGMTPGSARRP
ncbi:MAG TPA: transaldolase [Acidimicrobiales bacterium]|nr:transaldolase [Acidimicrobiales bacterium]